jgi:hypothetical protein
MWIETECPEKPLRPEVRQHPDCSLLARSFYPICFDDVHRRGSHQGELTQVMLPEIGQIAPGGEPAVDQEHRVQ